VAQHSSALVQVLQMVLGLQRVLELQQVLDLQPAPDLVALIQEERRQVRQPPVRTTRTISRQERHNEACRL
jgi:hypothetical protein